VCRQSKLQHLQQVPRRGSFFHAGVPQLRNNKQASGASLHLHLDLTRPKTLHADCNIEPVRCLAPGYSRLSCCNRTGQPSSAGPDISLLRPELQRSGIMPKISSWETGRSQPAAVCVCGGVVTSVRVGFRTNGWPLSATGRISTPNAPFAPTTVCANTTPC